MASSSDGRERPSQGRPNIDVEMEIGTGKRKIDDSDILTNLESLSEEQLAEIIGIVKKKHNSNQTPQKNPEPEDNTDQFTLVSYKSKKTTPQKADNQTYTEQQNLSTSNTRHTNVSARMNEILNRTYNHLFYINTPPQITVTRIQMADIWETERPKNNDTILKTKKGFLLKTDIPKIIISNTLKNLQTSGKISNYSSTSPYNQATRSTNIPSQSYSCVIKSVETDILDTQIADHLRNLNFNFRYCKRIIAKKNKPTNTLHQDNNKRS